MLADALQNCKRLQNVNQLIVAPCETIIEYLRISEFKRIYNYRWYEYQGDPDMNDFISFRMIFNTDRPRWNESTKTCDEMYDVSLIQR